MKKNAFNKKAAPTPEDMGKELLLILRRHDGMDVARAVSLIEKGAQLDLSDNFGMTALTRAAFRGQRAILQAILKAGVDPDQRGADDKTALIWAAGWGHGDVAETLLDAKADINAQGGPQGRTALMSAAFFREESVVDFLLARGADPSLRDDDGRSAADHARRSPEGEKLGERLDRFLQQQKKLALKKRWDARNIILDSGLAAPGNVTGFRPLHVGFKKRKLKP